MNCQVKNDTTIPDISAILSEKIEEKSYKAWFSGCNFLVQQETLELVFKDASSMNFVKQKYSSIIKELCDNFGYKDLAFKIKSSEKYTPIQQTNNANIIELKPNRETQEFIQDSSNKTALSTINYLLENQNHSLLNGKILHVCGGRSFGKTAILRYFQSKIGNELSIIFSGTEFVNLYSNAVKSNTLIDFRNKIFSKKFLIIDDLHMLAGQKGTLLEILKTSSFFQDSQKTIITASSFDINDMPKDINLGLKNFDFALSLKIEEPSFDLKKNLSASILSGHESSIHEKIAKKAKNLNDVKSISTQLKLSGSQDFISFEDQTQGVISDDFKTIISTVEKYFKFSSGSLFKKSTTHQTSLAKYVAIYILRKNTNLTMSNIASILGFKSHANIVRAVKKCEDGKSDFVTKIITEIENLIKL